MHPPEKVGLIAGQGHLPELLLSRWEQNGLVPVVVGLDGITPPELLVGRVSRVFSIGQAGHILDFLKSQGVTKLVMAGGLRRPNFWTLRTDFVGLQIVLKVLFRKVGDDTLLRVIRSEIEKWGVHVVGAYDYLPELLCPAGVLGAVVPTGAERDIIARGFSLAKEHGAADKGQSVVVSADGEVGYEGVSGTNALIRSCAGRVGAVLVKVSKPQQDMAFDMPTIGVSTVEGVAAAGFKGIAVEAGRTIVLDRAEVIAQCDARGLFLMGIGGGHDV